MGEGQQFVSGTRRRRPACDIIRDGVDEADLRADGDRAVWAALVSTAASRMQRSDTQAAWARDVLDDPRTALGRQVKVRANGKTRTALAVTKMLLNAWTAAETWLATQPPAWGTDDARVAAEERAGQYHALADDPRTDLSPGERKVLHHVADVAAKRGSTRLTMPRRDLMDATGLGLTTLRTALARLEKRGYLTLAERGKPRGKYANRRPQAAVYRLAPLPVPGSPVSGAPQAADIQVSGAPRSDLPGAPGQVSGAPLPRYVADYARTATPEAAAALRALLDAGGRR